MAYEMTSRQTNLTLLSDFYEFTMAQAYFKQGVHERTACFDLFFRQVPERGGYAIMAGVNQMIEYIERLNFDPEIIAYLRQEGFHEDFLDYLKNLDFKCDIEAVPEGTPIFPGEPIVKVKGPLLQCQLIETMLLLSINHQSLIATKSARIVRAAEGRPVMEFGARRAQGYDASLLGARAAYIAGVAGTSCTLAAQIFGMPALGTMAHSWVQSFPSEYEAFKAYAEVYPENTQLLIDTYNTLQSGIPNAIRVHREILEPQGHRLAGVRIDSGDLTYLSIKCREALDAAGLEDCKIIVSNSIDEHLIRELLVQGAKIDGFGVGERLITSRAEPVFSGVYKLSAIENEAGELEPRMKISENPGKITNPASKTVYRLYNEEGYAEADLICLEEERPDLETSLEIFDPLHTWKRKTLNNFKARKLLEPIFKEGRRVYPEYSLEEIRKYARKEFGTLWDSIKRLENPQIYYVDLSQQLWDLKDQILQSYTRQDKRQGDNQ
ncbi:MAG: nicotinate phosphoribosyltransferase [Eubacteriales bacterium]|nr:nicotinate phosphoribosyltransferase [Eubacteriales bacterium]